MYFWFYCIFILYILDIHSVMTLDMKTLLFYQIKFIYDVLGFVNFLFLFYSIFFSDYVANDEESELQGALISKIFCEVDLRENICFMFYRHHCAM